MKILNNAIAQIQSKNDFPLHIDYAWEDCWLPKYLDIKEVNGLFIRLDDRLFLIDTFFWEIDSRDVVDEGITVSIGILEKEFDTEKLTKLIVQLQANKGGPGSTFKMKGVNVTEFAVSK